MLARARWVRVLRVLYDPMEQARARRNMGIIAIGLVFIVAAKPIVNFITGGALSSPPPGLESVANTFNNILTFAQWIGGALAVLAFIYNAIKFFASD